MALIWLSVGGFSFIAAEKIDQNCNGSKVGNLTILPFENYTNFQVGPSKGTQNILEFEPVAPIHLNQDWNLIPTPKEEMR